MTLFPSGGLAANGKQIYSWDQAAAQLTRSGSSWSFSLGQSATITYGFRATAPSSMPTDTSGFSQFNTAQIIAAEAALQLWSDVANITFLRVGAGTSGAGAYSNNATILFSNYATGPADASAFAYFPSPGATSSSSRAGDVWVDAGSAGNLNPILGEFGAHTLAHEIGHAIGISHPGDYDGGSPTYDADAVYWQDARMWTIMSYFGSTNTGGVIPNFAWGPQYHDIAAAQRLYGANTSTRTGDTVYGFNSNSGRSLFEITSASQGVTFSIWDAGGNDTLDLSGYAENAEIDLRPGAFSSAGPTSDRGPAQYNISIAVGAVIENAVGGSGADTITGNDAANSLFGRNGADDLFGGLGADSLHGENGNDTVNGGAGADQLFGENNDDILNGGDGFSLSANGGSVFRLYQATLDRSPDVSGFNNWVAALNSGQSLGSITTGFINSTEFQSVYGALNNTQFVTLLYNNVLERSPDQQGLNNWVNLLNSGTSRETVVNGFSESLEFKTTSLLAETSFATFALYGETSGQVFRLYDATLDRAPDEGGFTNWTAALAGGQSLVSVATGFVSSTEFQTTYGSLNNTQFVTLLYNNVLNRAPDQPGLDSWVSLLNSGSSRASVVIGFSESNEHKSNTSAALTAYLQSGLPSYADTVTGGAGSDRLFGGRGPDQFDFSAAAVGSDHVYGVELIDTIRLAGFGYANAAAALTHFSQIGQDVVFSDQGQIITFHDTNLTTIQAASFLFG